MPFKTEEHRSKRDKTLVALKGSSDRFSHHRLEGGAFWRPPRELAPMPTSKRDEAKRALVLLLKELGERYGVTVNVTRDSPDGSVAAVVALGKKNLSQVY